MLRPAAAPRSVIVELFEAHGRDIHRYVERRLGHSLAQDLTAETFRVAIEQWPRFSPSLGPERAWLFGIASNLIRRHWRTERRRLAASARLPVDGEADYGGVGDVEARIDDQARVERVLKAIDLLQPEDRDLIALIAWERLSYRDAASALGIPSGTIGSRLHRIRTILREGAPDDSQR